MVALHLVLFRKHGVTPGTIAITRPSMLTAAPYTHGMPCFTAPV